MKTAARSARRRMLFCALVAALPMSVSAQSWPKLVTNGHGLALTKFHVEERMQGNWVASPSLRQNVDFRLVMRFTNFYPATISYGRYVNEIIRLSFSAELPGAAFYPSASYYGSGTKWLNGYDVAGLEATRSKTYYQHFRWNGPPIPIPLTTWTVTFGGAEVYWLPKATGPIRPS